MAVTQRGYGQWHSSVCDKTFTSVEAAEFYDQQQALRSEFQDPEQAAAQEWFDGLSADKILLLTKQHQREVEEASGKAQLDQDIATVVARNPDYEDDPARGGSLNGDRVVGYLVGKGRAAHPSVYDLQEAIDELRAAGRLVLKPVPEGEQRTEPDEAELEQMARAEIDRRTGGLWQQPAREHNIR